MIRSLISGFSGSSGSTPTSWVKVSVGTVLRLSGVTYGNNKFVFTKSGNSVYTSIDGITWGISANITWTARSSIYGASTFVAVGNYNETSMPAIHTSPDGITWTSRSATGFGSTAFIMDICWSGTYFVVVSDEGHIATASSTGSSWTQRAKHTNPFNCVTYGGGVYVALGNNELFTSTNGTTWTNRTATAPFINSKSVVYVNGLFVVVGTASKIFTSADGINWTKRTSPFGVTGISSVTYGGGKFVAVGDSGKIATSTDGINWLLSESPVTTNLRNVTYGAGKFVAVGDSGTVITSPTGL